MTLLSPDIEAEIHFLMTEEGGRHRPVTSGYRPHHDFGFEGMLDAAHDYGSERFVAPGESAIACLAFPPIGQEFLAGKLHEGFEFSVREGARIVGRGRITKVLNDALLRTEP